MPDLYPFPSGPHGMPSPLYRHRHAYAPLDPVPLAGDGTAVLAVRYDDVREVLAGPAFSRRVLDPDAPRVTEGEELSRLDPDAPDLLINMDPPRHTRLRRVLAGALSPRRIASWRPVVERIADGLLDRLTAPADLVAGYAMPLPIAVISEVLGVSIDDREDFVAWSELALSAADLDEEERIDKALRFFGYLERLIAERRATPGEGFVDTLVGGGELTESEALRTVGLLVVGGYETTSTVLARGLYTLLVRPERYRALRGGDVPAVVEEILRCHPASDAALLRLATEDVTLPSGPVRAGQYVLPVTAAANQDQSVFPDPETFDPDRPGPPAHLSFGHGPHYCPGAGLARLELTVALERLAARFPGLRLAVPADEIGWLDTALVRRPTRLPVDWDAVPARD
ncbi:cytochrome P450 [Bailinhaonella thermotolerans]|uniref:Cytochrome P450 n=1 Tax=Bailinhaonella thermotolerans TaxID=1070861 RepID=A0A3A4B5L7_9ACTN|nr:cytochrome P450 [Bailinhaonella thermotolerans]RJL35920.1 cytochrome P450 [Bailinhaonella thermotolerans]